MSEKLFVGGLCRETTDATLFEAFERFGPVVKATVAVDPDTGRSRGFGFVTFEAAQYAQAAIAGMDGREIDGCLAQLRLGRVGALDDRLEVVGDSASGRRRRGTPTRPRTSRRGIDRLRVFS